MANYGFLLHCVRPVWRTLPLAFAATLSLAQNPATIAVDDPRALAQAIIQMERKTLIPVNYEDIPYSYPGDMVDVSAKVMTPAQQAAHPGAHIWVPRGGPLSVSLPIAATGSVASSAVPLMLGALVAAHSKAGFPGSFDVSVGNGSFFVTPSQASDATGAVAMVTRVFDTKINLPFQERSGEDTLDAILSQVSTLGHTQVGLASGPLGALITSRAQIGAADEQARSVIVRLLAAIETIKSVDGVVFPAFAYDLFADPGKNQYLLNIIGMPSPSVAKPIRPPLQATPSGQNPYSKH